MRIIDPGHCFALIRLDGGGEEMLTFVKREGDGYPGNVGHHTGTTSQEVMRALISRAKYVEGQIPHKANGAVIYHLRAAIRALERRAYERHGIPYDVTAELIENLPTNSHGHVWLEKGES